MPCRCEECEPRTEEPPAYPRGVLTSLQDRLGQLEEARARIDQERSLLLDRYQRWCGLSTLAEVRK